MTKIKKFWISTTFWLKLKSIITLFGAGGEITLILTEQNAEWHVLTITATVLGVLITNIIEDKDNNGKVDLFEK